MDVLVCGQKKSSYLGKNKEMCQSALTFLKFSRKIAHRNEFNEKIKKNKAERIHTRQ